MRRILESRNLAASRSCKRQGNVSPADTLILAQWKACPRNQGNTCVLLAATVVLVCYSSSRKLIPTFATLSLLLKIQSTVYTPVVNKVTAELSLRALWTLPRSEILIHLLPSHLKNYWQETLFLTLVTISHFPSCVSRREKKRKKQQFSFGRAGFWQIWGFHFKE